MLSCYHHDKSIFILNICHTVTIFLTLFYIGIQSTKIIVVYLKYKMILVLYNWLYFNVWLFSIAPCKVTAINILCFIFCINSLLIFSIEGAVKRAINKCTKPIQKIKEIDEERQFLLPKNWNGDSFMGSKREKFNTVITIFEKKHKLAAQKLFHILVTPILFSPTICM